MTNRSEMTVERLILDGKLEIDRDVLRQLRGIFGEREFRDGTASAYVDAMREVNKDTSDSNPQARLGKSVSTLESTLKKFNDLPERLNKELSGMFRGTRRHIENSLLSAPEKAFGGKNILSALAKDSIGGILDRLETGAKTRRASLSHFNVLFGESNRDAKSAIWKSANKGGRYNRDAVEEASKYVRDADNKIRNDRLDSVVSALKRQNDEVAPHMKWLAGLARVFAGFKLYSMTQGHRPDSQKELEAGKRVGRGVWGRIWHSRDTMSDAMSQIYGGSDPITRELWQKNIDKYTLNDKWLSPWGKARRAMRNLSTAGDFGDQPGERPDMKIKTYLSGLYNWKTGGDSKLTFDEIIKTDRSGMEDLLKTMPKNFADMSLMRATKADDLGLTLEELQRDLERLADPDRPPTKIDFTAQAKQTLKEATGNDDASAAEEKKNSMVSMIQTMIGQSPMLAAIGAGIFALNQIRTLAGRIAGKLAPKVTPSVRWANAKTGRNGQFKIGAMDDVAAQKRYLKIIDAGGTRAEALVARDGEVEKARAMMEARRAGSGAATAPITTIQNNVNQTTMTPMPDATSNPALFGVPTRFSPLTD